MAVTVTPDTRFNTNPTMLATGLKLLGGEASLGTYASGGISMTIPGMNNVLGVLFDPTIAGYMLRYVPSTGKVLMYYDSGASTPGALTVVASGTATAATGTFLAFGY